MKKYPEWVHWGHDWSVRLRQFPVAPGFRLNGRDRYEPFFIVGSGRSGTTLLRRLLVAHKGVHIPPETYVLGEMVKVFRQYGRMRWKDLVYLLFAKLAFHPEFHTFQISLGELAREVADCDSGNRNLAYLIDRFYRYHAEQAGLTCIRWGDKTPVNTFCLERLLKVFPDARFINMIRDGYDVVVSYRTSGIYRDVEEAANRWRLAVSHAHRFSIKHPGVLLDVRYEDLVNETEAELSTVMDFLNIQFELASLDADSAQYPMGDVESHGHHSRVTQPIDTSSVGRGSQHLTSDEIRRVSGVIGGEIARLGYKVL